MTVRICEFPAVEPSEDNPAGDCRKLATRATRLGNGHAMPLCQWHASRYPEGRTFPVEDIVDE